MARPSHNEGSADCDQYGSCQRATAVHKPADQQQQFLAHPLCPANELMNRIIPQLTAAVRLCAIESDLIIRN